MSTKKALLPVIASTLSSRRHCQYAKRLARLICVNLSNLTENTYTVVGSNSGTESIAYISLDYTYCVPDRKLTQSGHAGGPWTCRVLIAVCQLSLSIATLFCLSDSDLALRLVATECIALFV